MQVTLRNFQGHENSTLEFIPGINVITGPNGHGKSSIIRAMRSVALGEKLSRRHNTSKSSVEIDGCAKLYEGGKNKYQVDGVVYEAMRKALPKELTDKLKLSDVNFRSQHQPYFLLSDSPGAVARAMNDLTDLGVIDYVASALKQEESAISLKKTQAVEAIESEKGKAQALDWAVDADVDLKVIEGLQNFLSEINTQVAATQKIVSEVINMQEKLSSLPPVEVIDDFISARDKLDDQHIVNLSFLVEKIKSDSDWLGSLPDDMSIGLRSVQETLSKPSEIPSLTSLVDRVTEYAQDLKLCPDPAGDIAALRSINIINADDLRILVSEVTSLSTRMSMFNSVDDSLSIELAKCKATMVSDAATVLAKTVLVIRANSTKLEELNNSCVEAEVMIKEAFKEVGHCPLCGGKV